MDLHPIIVHTPVALLTLVALCEFITIIPAVRRSTQFFWVRVFLLMVGFIATFLATMSGDNAWHLHRATVNPYLVHTHEEYASMTQIAFGILAALYLLRIFALDIFTTEHRLGSWILKLRATRIGDLKARMGRWLARNIWVTIIMALVGLGLVTITGALGGAIVYGPNAQDPVIPWVVTHVCGTDCVDPAL